MRTSRSMGNKLSANQHQQIKAAFTHFDVDGNGEITLDEFQVYIFLSSFTSLYTYICYKITSLSYLFIYMIIISLPMLAF